MEKSLVPLDSAAHPILQCTFPEASAMNHKSACLILLCGDGTAISMRPIDLCEDTLANQREKSTVGLLCNPAIYKEDQTETNDKQKLRLSTKHDASVYFCLLTIPAIWWQVGITVMPEDLLVSSVRYLNCKYRVPGTLANGHYHHYQYLTVRLFQISKGRSTVCTETLLAFQLPRTATSEMVP